MNKREVIIEAIEHRRPPYVPWSLHAPAPLVAKARERLGVGEDEDICCDHIGYASCALGTIEPVDDEHAVDAYGVSWSRTSGHGMGMPLAGPLTEPSLAGYEMPDAEDGRWYEGLAEKFDAMGDCFKLYIVRFDVFERAYLLRGMENLMIDMFEHPDFVGELLDALCANGLVQIRRAAAMGVDAVHFCADYGTQHGLLMSPEMWRRFIKPRLARQYAAVRQAGLYVSQHSCGKVDELFDDFVEIGLSLYNPFQPEVMDVFALMERYRGRLAFFGGLGVQHTLPAGTDDQVRAETRKLLAAGAEGGLILAPSGSIGADVPVENFLAVLETLKSQPGVPA